VAFWTHPERKFALFCLCLAPLPNLAQSPQPGATECVGSRQSISGTVTDASAVDVARCWIQYASAKHAAA